MKHEGKYMVRIGKNRENVKGFKEEGIDPQIIASVTGLSLKEFAAM